MRIFYALCCCMFRQDGINNHNDIRDNNGSFNIRNDNDCFRIFFRVFQGHGRSCRQRRR